MNPAWEGYFADPHVARDGERYVAVGTEDPTPAGDRVFPVLTSPDLETWQSEGHALHRLDAGLGDTYWAPEIVQAHGCWWMYYSVGHGISGHHVRVARSDKPTGPYLDEGVVLTPGERFAIDPHPFLGEDGHWYLFFARDVLDHERPGTHLAVAPLASMTELAADAVAAVAPWSDAQIYQRDRLMYGETRTWHTVEGPAVVHRDEQYLMTFSSGPWTGPDYAVKWARADHPLGPWHVNQSAPALLSRTDGYVGPGHNSFTVAPTGADVIAFHAWDNAQAVRQMHLRRISFEQGVPRIDGPIRSTPV